ncbi:SDR family NAD(P)-dependent oxidoreductase [Halalkalicoccus jeotgali]|uniref:Short-chain dehydrogenase/reductase SDR n=1 Tax=Halalkalicoccus jeotgali (strain DSM 18796 / CECT 7217 / JCM 14584 / KCTC 4019 / B3) TaxID=795797 RepID=D8J7G5_HALJB|nr:SDR family oxidoreductase [Halalkalicoccus jeotgali]ADJ14060.1 short-chain dehydrogenase/reductase SDR [Halalkalicoccus jeotgali B3]ELY33896.1 short-chain dehydrogenase/reductase SDR [Halalkalicoccus jeotgali B3]
MGSLNPDFTDETVVVTGGSSGIGRAIAIAFGDAGATVLNADLDPEPKDTGLETPTHEVIRNADGTAAYVECDVADPEQLDVVIEAARELDDDDLAPGVDVMVNNAGLYTKRRFRDVSPEEFDRVNAVNARGAFFGTQKAANDMIERDDPGVIVNTTSDTQGRATWDHSHYAASKGAIRMLTRSAALELAGDGVRVNAVAPGPIATEIREGWAEEARKMEPTGETPDLPRYAGKPADLPGAYLYLASDDASYVTGETIWVDGGGHVC